MLNGIESNRIEAKSNRDRDPSTDRSHSLFLGLVKKETVRHKLRRTELDTRC